MDKRQQSNSQEVYYVTGFYQFVQLDDLAYWQSRLKKFCLDHELQGILLIAAEGINGTLSGTEEDIRRFQRFLLSHDVFRNIAFKEQISSVAPFYRLRVRLKKETITLGLDHLEIDKYAGEHVSPKQWDRIIQQPDVLVLDTRNHYEYDLGTFENAIKVDTENFGEFPQFVEQHLADKKSSPVAMFCTGGIRCEKASAYLKSQGFDKVYQLDGGVLNYLSKTPDGGLWRGECYVFDKRVSVNHKLEPGSYEICYACRTPLSAEDRQSQDYIEGVQCHHCVDRLSNTQRKRFLERQKQIELSETRGDAHLGKTIQPQPPRLRVHR